MPAIYLKVKCYSYDRSVPILSVPAAHPPDALDSPTIELPDLVAGKFTAALSF